MPNFFIVGAHKAGTTSLYHYLKEHPQVFMPVRKESRFFAYDDKNPDHRKKVPDVFPITNICDYEALFDGVNKEIAIGEASPEYLNSPIAPSRIKELVPNAKIIVSLRNPVDRAYSEYLMYLRAGKENRALDQVINRDERWSQTSLYYEKLKSYIEIFGIDKVKIVLFNDLKSAPSQITTELYSFLDVTTNYVPNTDTQHNQGGIPKIKLLHQLISNRRFKNLVKPFTPIGLRSAVRKLKTKNLEKAPALTKEQRTRFLTIFQEDIIKTQALINKDLSDWLTI